MGTRGGGDTTGRAAGGGGLGELKDPARDHAGGRARRAGAAEETTHGGRLVAVAVRANAREPR